MKLLILGSTGATGRLLSSFALDRGHDLRALVRRPEEELPAAIEVVAGDARDQGAVTGALGGVDTVVTALGMGLKTKPNGLMVEATNALIQAAAATGVRRAVMLASWGGRGDAGAVLAEGAPGVPGWEVCAR